MPLARNVVHREPRPSTPEQATALLDAVVTRRQHAPRRAVRAASPHRHHPDWGASGPCPLAITVDLERGWLLVIDQPTGSPVVDIVNEGAYGNVFHR